MGDYVHGYTDRENERLRDQADAVRELIHGGTSYPPGSLVLEAGCGIGAQTGILLQRSPGARFIAVDQSADSLDQAGEHVRELGLTGVEFKIADIHALPFDDYYFDHVFVCFLLEHLIDPGGGLLELKRVLKPGGTITVIEGDHGSCHFHPETDASKRAWHSLIRVQASLGGDSLIGRRLHPLLRKAGYADVRVSPRIVAVDSENSGLMDAFVGKTIIPMVEGVKEKALRMGVIDGATWKRGIEDLRTIETCGEGVFYYTFYKAWGVC